VFLISLEIQEKERIKKYVLSHTTQHQKRQGMSFSQSYLATYKRNKEERKKDRKGKRRTTSRPLLCTSRGVYAMPHPGFGIRSLSCPSLFNNALQGERKKECYSLIIHQ